MSRINRNTNRDLNASLKALHSFIIYIFSHLYFRNEQLPRDFRLKDNSFQMTSFTYLEIQEKTDKRLQVRFSFSQETLVLLVFELIRILILL